MKANETTVTRKSIYKLVEELYNSNFTTLSGCVKTFTEAVKSSKKEDIATICSRADMDNKTATKIALFCKDRGRAMKACLAMLPNIDGIICEYRVVAKDYLQKDRKNDSFSNIEKLEESLLLGKIYKPYGYNKNVVELVPTSVNYILKETDVASTTYAPFAVKSFTCKKIARAIADYIAACEKAGVDWNEK